MFCTCVSFNTWAPALLKDLTRLFFCDRGRSHYLPPRGSVSLENGPIGLPWGTEFITEPRPHWSNNAVRRVRRIKRSNDVATCDFIREPFFKTHSVKNLEPNQVMCVSVPLFLQPPPWLCRHSANQHASDEVRRVLWFLGQRPGSLCSAY